MLQFTNPRTISSSIASTKPDSKLTPDFHFDTKQERASRRRQREAEGTKNQQRFGGNRRGRDQDEHHHIRATSPTSIGAAALLLHTGVEDPIRRRLQRGADEAIHPRLQASVRALLRACSQQDCPRRAAEELEAQRRQSRGLTRHPPQVRQHLQQQHLVRAGVSRGQGAGPEGRSGVAAVVRVGF